MGLRILALCAILGACGVPAAANVLPPVYIGVTGGPLGGGPEITYKFNSVVAVRASARLFDVQSPDRGSGFRSANDIHIDDWGGALDLYPLASVLGGLRLSAGARVTEHNRVGFTGQVTDTRNYGGLTFDPGQSGSISGKVHALSLSPMAAIGYARHIAGVNFGIDAGAMYNGTPGAGDFRSTSRLACLFGAQGSDLSEQQRSRYAAGFHGYYPVVQVRMGYRF